MWLLKNMAENNRAQRKPDRGAVDLSTQTYVNVQASGDHREVPVVAPFGFSGVPVRGTETVLLPVAGGNVCLGSIVRDNGLEPGEIMLYSAGGASLVLKNDGSILANGKNITGGV